MNSNRNEDLICAPIQKVKPVVGQGQFVIAAIALNHGHICGMCKGLIEAGAQLKWVYDQDIEKVKAFINKYPGVRVASSVEEILEDPEVHMVAAAEIPSERSALGIKVMAHGKDYFTDKAPFTTLEQLELAQVQTVKTKQKYMVNFSERLHVESSVYAGYLVRAGVIGRVLQVIGLGPHSLRASTRPEWFFEREKYGGIICDIGLGAWGDGRTIIMGTEGYIELRKNIDIGRSKTRDHVYWVDGAGEHYEHVTGKVGYPFFGELILDCLNRTEQAMTQAHVFKAAELCLKAQAQAVNVTP